MGAIGFTKGAATRAERNPGARPPTLRYLAVATLGATDNRPYRRPGKAEAKAARVARKAARRAFAKARRAA